MIGLFEALSRPLLRRIDAEDAHGLAILAALPLCLVLFFLRVPEIWNGLAAVAQIAVLSPILVRYSRVLWLHFDQRFDPR